MSAAPATGAGRLFRAAGLCLLTWAGSGHVIKAQAQLAAPLASFSVQVSPGQSATELAADRVPSGTTIDQFLLALYRLNPQAFLGGDINRLRVHARLQLPSADEANRVPLDQAREQLSRLRAAQGAVAVPEAVTAGAAPVASASASAAPEPAPEPAPPSALPPAASKPVPVPATQPPPAGSTSTALPWLALAGAGIALAGLTFWRKGRHAGKVAPAAPHSNDLEAQAQGRFQPVLPGDRPSSPQGVAASARPEQATARLPVAPVLVSAESSRRIEPQHPGLSTPAPVTAPPSVAASPRPALFDLDLSLDGQAPPLDLGPVTPKPLAAKAAGPSGLGLGHLSLDLHAPSPPPAKPGPLPLGGLSLDLDTPAKAPAPGPLDLSGLSLDLDPKNKATS